MTLDPDSSISQPAGPLARLSDRWGRRIAWVLVVVMVGVVIYRVAVMSDKRQAVRQAEGESNADKTIPAHYLNPQLVPQAKGILAAGRQFGGGSMSAVALRDAAKTPAERVWIVPVLAELEGKNPALSFLSMQVPPATTQAAGTQPSSSSSALAHDVANLRHLYASGPESLSPDDRQRLVDRLGWSGKLALQFGKPDADPARAELLANADRLMLYSYSLFGLAGVGLLIGIVLLVLAAVWLANGRLRTRYGQLPPPIVVPPPSPWVRVLAPRGVPPPLSYGRSGASIGISTTWRSLGDLNGRSAPFVEAFALYLLLYIGIGLLVIRGLEVDPVFGQWFPFLAVPVAMLWPKLRGVSWEQWRRGFGWSVGRGVLREMGAGVVAYVTGLPFFVAATIVSLLLSRLGGASPHHPIIDELSDGGLLAVVQVVIHATILAPLVEETFFRGALFHDLRTRCNWIVAAMISSVVFAAVHPQGWSLVPSLGSLAIVFCAMREWRTSCIGSMTAHAIHNGVVVTLAILGMS